MPIAGYRAFVFGTAVCCSFAAPTDLQANPGLSGTVNAVPDAANIDHVTTDPTGAPVSLSDIGSGWLAATETGILFAPNLRGSFVYTSRSGYHLEEAPATKSSQRASPSNAFMANIYAEMPIREPSIVPFIGGGVGWAQMRTSSFAAAGMSAVNPLVISSATNATLPLRNEGNVAWQAMAGIGFQLVEGVKVDLYYRFFDGSHANSRATNLTVNRGITGDYSGAEGALHAHEVALSLRIGL